MEERQHTHIVIRYDSQDSDILFRAVDGIAIGQRKRTVIVYGEDSNKKQSRVFIDSEHAKQWLRGKCADLDLTHTGAPGPVSIDERDGEPLIQMPGDVVELPGGIRNFN